MYRLIYILLLLPIITFGQKSPVNTHYGLEKPHPLDLRKSKVSFQTVHIGSSRIEDVEKYIKYSIDNLKNSSNISLKLIHNIESPAGIHLTFVQLYRSIPIYRSQVKVNLDKKGNIRSIFDNSFTITKSLSDNFPDVKIISDHLNNIRSLQTSNIKDVYFYGDKQLVPAVKIEVSETDDSNYEVIINNKGEVLYQKDLNRYLHPFFLPATKLIQPMQQDSLISAHVFNPDPLTTAGVIYGSPYIDDNNNDVSELDSELVKVNIAVDFTNDTFRLSGPYAKTDEFSSPTVTPAYSTTPFFHYTRSQQGFEEVNAYYHINVFQQYLQSLGFTNLVNYPVRIDAHALNGSDQSMYVSGKIYFGDGGVDDAEDADVIIHEYSHAIMESAAPGTFSGTERQALEEGFGDYLAVSYSRNINSYNWQNIFSWDGHNEFWGGRNAATTKHYPEDLSGDIHLDGEIWSSALMQVWEDIGRETTDQILLQSSYSYATGMSMTDAAYLFLQTDSMLNSGVNYSMIYTRFQDRGFLSPVSIHDLNDPGSLIVFPNPTAGIINIKFDLLKTCEKITSIRVYNTTGQIINKICDKSILRRDNYVLDLSGQLRGVYFLIITSPIEIIPLKLIKL